MLHAIRFWSSTPSDNITLTPANRKADWSLSEFQTGIGSVPLSTQSSSFLTSELPLLMLFPLYPIIPVSGVCELLTKVHDILHNAVSK